MSGIRFLLAPAIGYMTVKGLFMPGLVTFAFASVLDFCDGYVARHFNQRSRLGTLIDPVADKTLMICLAASMGYVGLVHAPVAALIIGKDVLMGLGFFALAWKHGYRSPKQMVAMVKALEVKPSMLGKTNTALQMVLFILGMCRPLWGIPSVQLFLPLEGIVSLTTVGTLLSYAMTVNKAVKWDVVDRVVKGGEVKSDEVLMKGSEMKSDEVLMKGSEMKSDEVLMKGSEMESSENVKNELMKEENPVMKEKSVVTEKKEPSMKQKDDIEQENKDETEKDNETTQNNKFN
ncbi:Cardiolipin synthase [Blastocystis sp. ATCC 50177/Nand II]|uniref:Cardiolipin synthase n=1 Tax=Blastocystis sp. subtype 1 (strain ATCC 50177 / NandII) TaxID=478820 RepID=A0A196SGK5_BLAHN|nr:Cardiolipin synthase [Blastocystis sp. ATCC 50177/Nand II]